MAQSVHQETTFVAAPARIYEALMNSAQHAEFTGAPAEISPDVGGACSWHGGKITGRNLCLEPGRRIVQAWRAEHWAPGLFSIIKYELVAEGGGKGTRVIFDHTGTPDGTAEHLATGWNDRYWEPLAKFLS